VACTATPSFSPWPLPFMSPTLSRLIPKTSLASRTRLQPTSMPRTACMWRGHDVLWLDPPAWRLLPLKLHLLGIAYSGQFTPWRSLQPACTRQLACCIYLLVAPLLYLTRFPSNFTVALQKGSSAACVRHVA
jgi:hypothetical protein